LLFLKLARGREGAGEVDGPQVKERGGGFAGSNTFVAAVAVASRAVAAAVQAAEPSHIPGARTRDCKARPGCQLGGMCFVAVMLH
jgi:hypothetical protein